MIRGILGSLPMPIRMPFDERATVQVFGAILKDGVFKPDQRPTLSESARVRLVVETIEANQSILASESWTALQQLWSTSRFISAGDRMNRDQWHERR